MSQSNTACLCTNPKLATNWTVENWLHLPLILWRHLFLLYMNLRKRNKLLNYKLNDLIFIFLFLFEHNV